FHHTALGSFFHESLVLCAERRTLAGWGGFRFDRSGQANSPDGESEDTQLRNNLGFHFHAVLWLKCAGRSPSQIRNRNPPAGWTRKIYTITPGLLRYAPETFCSYARAARWGTSRYP